MTERPRYVLVSFVFDLNNSPEDVAARVERQLAELARMADVGLGLCRELVTQMKSPEGLSCDPSHAYGRISRAVRLTIVLENRIVKEYQQVLEVLNTSIASELENNPDCDRKLLAEMRESLPKTIAQYIEREDLHETAPISQVIEIISQALDIPVDWSLWKDTDWISENEPPERITDPPNTSHPAEVDPDTEPVEA